MSNPAFDLFLLATSLSQMKNREIVIASFIGGVNALFPELSIGWADGAAPERQNRVEVCTRKETFGFLVFSGDTQPDEMTGTLIHNAGQMLGVILERIRQDQLLRERNETLATLAGERARAAEELEVRVAQRTAELEKANEALRESRRRLELALHGGGLGIWDWLPETGAVAYSDLWAEMLEYRPDEVAPTVGFFERHVHPDDLSSVLDRLAGHLEGRLPAYQSEHRLRTKSGRWIWVLDRGEVTERSKEGRAVRVTGIISDVTERKRAEEALVQYRDHLEELAERRAKELEVAREQARRADRLASIGTFAAGIAHEINNPLGMMLLATDVALASLDQPERLTELLQETRQTIERCARIVRGVLGFSKTQSAQTQPLNLNEVVRYGIEFSREYCAKQGVTVDVRLASRLGPVLGHLVELGQVVVNLIRNAVQACEAGGHVTIDTQEEGDRIRLMVHDDGCGMAPEQIQRVFDPFYTTRIEKGGTGLGLSIVHGIVTSHQGTIEVTSEEGRGTTFTVEFGRHTEPEANDGKNAGR